MTEWVWIGIGIVVFVVLLVGWRKAGKIFGSHESKSAKQG